VVNFHAMDKNAMLKFSEQHPELKVDKRWSEQKMREHITHAWSAKHMDLQGK
jgi:hypothetical protein